MNRAPWRLAWVTALALSLGGCAKVDLSALTVEAAVNPVLVPGESAEWVVTVVNAGSASIPIQDLDIAKSLLDGVVLDESRMQPPATAARDVVDYRSFRIGQDLAPGAELLIRLPVTAATPSAERESDTYRGDIDICVDNLRQRTVQVSYRVSTGDEQIAANESRDEAAAAEVLDVAPVPAGAPAAADQPAPVTDEAAARPAETVDSDTPTSVVGPRLPDDAGVQDRPAATPEPHAEPPVPEPEPGPAPSPP